jgi:outer membrane receptor for ferrienterochelin and colicin
VIPRVAVKRAMRTCSQERQTPGLRGSCCSRSGRTHGWNVSDRYALRAGVDNLLDRDPVNTGKTLGYPAGTNLTSICNGAPGCQNPTTYSIGNSGQGATSGGFYDVLGRRYYVGVKAQF